jgi:hypothetical protein
VMRTFTGATIVGAKECVDKKRRPGGRLRNFLAEES